MIYLNFKDSTYNAQFNLCFYSVDRFLMFVPVLKQLAPPSTLFRESLKDPLLSARRPKTQKTKLSKN